MRFLRYLKWLAPIGASALLIGCADSTTEPNFGPCSHSPYTGSNIQIKSSEAAIKDSGYFDKSLSLESVLSSFQASSRAIADSLRTQGVQVYRIKSSDSASSCRYHSYLPLASDFAQKKWAQNSSKSVVSIITSAKLLGLFTTIYSRENYSGKVSLIDPTIIVREDTQKWTMIHEMAHYLFAKARTHKKTMIFDRELKAQLKKLSQDINLLKKEHIAKPTKRRAALLTKAYSEFFDITHKLDRRGPLEEFAIESMISQASTEGKITAVDNKLFQKYSLNYMLSNAAIVARSYRLFLDKLEKQKAVFLLNSNQKAIENITELEALVQNKIDFMEEKMVSSPYWTSANAFGTTSQLPLEFDPFLQHFDLQSYREQQSLLNSL